MGWFSSLVGGIVGFFIGGPVGAVIGAGLGATKVGEKIVDTVLDFVTQPFMPNMPDAGGGAEADRQQGVLIQTQGSTVNVPVLYGYRKLGGGVTFAETGSTDNKYLYVVYVFAEGLVEGLREIFIDDTQIPVNLMANLNAGELVNITTEKYANRVQMRWSPGVYYANPRSSTLGTIVKGDIFSAAPSFTTDMNYNGLATLFVRYEWKKIETQADADNNPFSGSIPQVQVSLLGKRVASLLVNTTETGSYDANNIRYSTNPAECLLDYLRNPRYGKGLTNDDIDWETWKKAARKCNQTVTYVASGITGPILTMNMVLDTDATLMSNTKLMLQNFRAYMPYVQGKYKLRIEDAGNDDDILSGAATIVQTFTKDDIVSDITFNGIERSAKYNVVSVTYVDPDQKWSNQQVVYPESETERQTYIALDGNRENKYETTLGGITNYAIAKDFARLIFNKQRRQESCVFTATSKALELEPGDCIRIQSNLLNFGTDPWRIVSYKVNGDMTVDLGCVRNPDDIYPYVRAGEEDIVLPTYVPKGSIIYFPSSQNLPPVGLVPPTFAVFPPSTAVITPLPTNPPPTNPSGVDGGGVGGGTPGGGTAGPTVTEPTTPPTTPTPPTNVAPTPVPPPAPFSSVLTLKSSRAVAQSSGGFFYYLTFTQPADALYSYAILWYRENIYAPWVEIKNQTRPGAGGEIPFTIGPRPAGNYEFYIRAFASNGDGSQFVTNGIIAVPPNAAEQNPSLTGIATAGTVQVTSGWTLPASQIPATARYDDDIDLLEIRPKLVTGAIQNPRRMSVTINQITNTVSKVTNYNIDGVRIYYKYSTDTYYSFEDFRFETVSPQYYPGRQLQFDLAGDFGVAGTTNIQNYDFIVRLTYKDGKSALKQLGPARAPVELFTGSNNFISVGTGAAAVARVSSLAITTGSTIPTTDQDPNKTYATGADILPNIFSITVSPSVSTITWEFNFPTTNVTKFRGYKLRFREVIPGSQAAFTTVDIGAVAQITTGRIIFTLNNTQYQHGRTYEWAVTAQYSNAGVVTDCTNTFYTKGYLIPFGDYTANHYDRFGFTNITTAVALGNLVTAFPALPTIVAKSWTKIQPRQEVIDGSGVNSNSNFATADSSDVYRSGTNYYINRYYKLRFSAPTSGYNQLVIYRRVFDTNGAQRSNLTTVARYFGLGAWEKTVITMPTADADGFRTVYLRGPIDPNVFDRNYQLVAGATQFQSFYGSSGSYPANITSKVTDVFPYYGAGNTDPNSTSGKWVEYLIVLANSGVEETKALRLRDFFAFTRGSSYITEVEGFGVSNVTNNQIVLTTDYNTYPNGYKRNINEALVNASSGNIVNAKLNVGQQPSYPEGYFGTPNTTNNRASFSVVINSLTESGLTIY
jgi:hypothetical protein